MKTTVWELTGHLQTLKQKYQICRNEGDEHSNFLADYHRSLR